jgi:putative salt-induced outer membrane protein YdiY
MHSPQGMGASETVFLHDLHGKPFCRRAGLLPGGIQENLPLIPYNRAFPLQQCRKGVGVMYRRTAVLLLMFIAAAPLPVRADTIYLNNGDRITGDIERIDPESVSVQTGYAGVVVISRDAVGGIETAEDVAVETVAGERIEGALESRDTAQVLRSGEAERELPLETIHLAAPDMEDLDKLLKAQRPARWSGSVETGLSLRAGNTDTTDFTFASDIVRKSDRNTLTLTFSAAYGEADNVLNTRRMKGDLKWQHYLRDRLYLFGLTGAERDDGRKLDLRWQAGGGAGYDILDSEKRSFSAEAGFIYYDEKWDPFTPWEKDSVKNARRENALGRLDALWDNPGSGNLNDTLATIVSMTRIAQDIRAPLRDDVPIYREYVSLRLNAQYEQQLFGSSSLSEDLTLLPNVEDIGEFRMLSEFALTTPLTRKLDLRVSLHSEYDSTASDSSVDAWDHTLMSTLRYAF